MKARIWLLALILGAPVLGVVAARAARSNLEPTFRKEWAAQPELRNRPMPGFAEFCREQGPGQPICDRDASLATLGNISMITGIAGLLVLAAIAAGGYRARTNRETLLALFRPGLYVVASFLTALIVVHAGILLFTMFLTLERAPGALVIGIVLGAGSGVIAIGRAAFGVVQRAETNAFGRVLTPEAAGDLWKQTDSVAEKLGALRPDQIVVGLDPSFYVTEATVNTPDGSLSGRTLYCSLALARILTVEELAAIIGHELGHFRGEDTKWSERFYPIYRGSIGAIASLQDASSRRGWGALVLLPAIAMFNFFLEQFAVAERLHGRTREFLADRAGADATSPRAMATALVKVHAFGDFWGLTMEQSVQGLQQQKISKNLSALFADNVGINAKAELLDAAAETATSHPTDTHPPLSERLSSLGVELRSVQEDALMVPPGASAARLIPNADAYEEGLSDSYQRLIAQSIGINLNRPGGTPIRPCANCGTKVLPTQDGHCPSCGVPMER